jgi:hypothetical protein
MTAWDAQYRDPLPVPAANTWDILIVTIPHRHDKLCVLLAELDRQWQPGLGVLLYRDNLEQPVGVKRQALLEASAAAYVSFVDDDDQVSPYFVPRLMNVLSAGPDYAGFRARCWEKDEPGNLAEHSLRYGGWHTWPEKLVRDFSHLNPMRRELALLGQFAGDDREDCNWADQIRATGQVRTEEWIPDIMYEYRFDIDDCHATKRDPMPPDGIRPLPVYPWLIALAPAGENR